MSWKKYLKLLEQMGFEVFYQEEYSYHTMSGWDEPIEVPHHLAVAAHRGKNLLLVAKSFSRPVLEPAGVVSGALAAILAPFIPWRETISSATLYGCTEPPREEKTVKALKRISTGWTIVAGRYWFEITNTGGGIWSHHIEDLEEFNLVPWENPDPSLYLLNSEEARSNKDWEEKRDKVLSQAPDWVRGFIGIASRERVYPWTSGAEMDILDLCLQLGQEAGAGGLPGFLEEPIWEMPLGIREIFEARSLDVEEAENCWAELAPHFKLAWEAHQRQPEWDETWLHEVLNPYQPPYTVKKLAEAVIAAAKQCAEAETEPEGVSL